MTVTEIGCMGVKPGIDVMDETKPEGKVLPKAYNGVVAHPEGPHHTSWGLELEDPLKLWGFFDFDSVEHHERFARLYAADIIKELPTILTHGEFMKHISFTSSPSEALSSPLTEVIFAHFPGDLSDVDQNVATAHFEAALGQWAVTGSGAKAVSWGWSVENDFPVRGQEGQTGQAVVAVIGWTGLESQAAFQETEAFRKAKSEMENIRGLLKLSGFHVSLRNSEEQTE